MEFRVLGPLEVLGAGGPVRLGGPKQRAVLAFLLLDRNRAVPRDALVDALWRAHPPKTSAHTIQVFVSDLRKALEAEGEGKLVTRTRGYLLAVEDGEVDVDRFERLLARGREALAQKRPRAAAARLREALSLWRGPPLADFTEAPWARPEIARLEELRLACLEERIEADLALGRHAGLVGELATLIDKEPHRERLRAQLMLALYRSGRQADALDAYQDARRALVEELGIEPGPALQELQRKILQQDAELSLELLPRTRRPSLPTPLTPLVGREHEVETVVDLLADDELRLLTLTGPGGIGKTRLALAAAEGLAEVYADAVCFVGLASLDDPELVLPTIAHALGIGEHQGESIGTTLARALADRELLLVLDNVEHLLAAGPAIAGLMAACPMLRLLATSREPMHLQGEHEYPVPPLTEDESVELFLRRARAVKPGITAGSETREICLRLDRLPLAVELAAAHSKLLGPAAILDRLERRLPLLTGGPSDAPARQRTMRQAIDWSHELLSPDEQQLFARLSAFAGGFSLEAAERVCDASFSTLSSLVEKSLVQADDGRFSMLGVIREYASEHLDPEFRQRHSEFVLDLAREAEEGLRGADERIWIERLAEEEANIRAALTWLEQTGQTDAQLELIGCIWIFLYVRGGWREGLRWVEHALARSEGRQTQPRAKALSAAWGFAQPLGDSVAAQAYAEESLAIFRALGDRAGTARALSHLATGSTERGDHADAERLFDEAIDEARAAGDLRTLALITGNLGDLAMREGDFERAVSLSRETVAELRELGLDEPLGWALCNLAFSLALSGRDEEADRASRESLAIADRIGDVVVLVFNLVLLASLASGRSEAESAARLLGSAEALREQVGLALSGSEHELQLKTLTELRHALSPKAFDAAFAQGRSMSTEEAVAAALEAGPTPVGSAGGPDDPVRAPQQALR
jgi:predicted ATPase/DNA-binding SARP family transcriptional activator